MPNPKVIVVGGGLAGLAAVIKIAEMGGEVDLFSIVPVKRSHSVCAQGGINAAKNLKGEGDSTWQHFDDTVYGGDFLANQPPVKAMCEAAPGIIDLLGIFLLSIWIFRSEPRPFLGLVIVLGMRQIMQACVALPAPPDAIWHNPGFPSLLVTYGAAA